MSDLIRRSALLKIFDHDLKCFETNGKTEAEMYISVADMRKMINEQPTAYDVEKVVAELETKKGTYFDGLVCEGTMIRINEAIDIVRKGGIDG